MIVAADLGSTQLKTAVFTPDGECIARSSLRLPYSIRTNQSAELDPAAVEETFFQAVAESLSTAGLTPGRVRRFAITSQAQTFCVCEPDGKATGPFLGWTDTRADHEAQNLGKELGGRFHFVTGIPDISPELLLCKALWWKTHMGLHEKQRLVSLPTFLAMRLGAGHVSDRNLAAMTGFFSMRDNTWWNETMSRVGITADQLGSLVDPGVPIPLRARAGGFPCDLVFVGNDHTAGALGSGCAPGLPTLTVGTAGVFFQLRGYSPGPYSANGLWGPWPKGGFYELHHFSHACSALDWADRFLFSRDDSEAFVRAATQTEPRIDSPFFFPENWGDQSAWTSPGKPEVLALAVLEGISFRLWDIAGRPSPDTDATIAILGGGSRLDSWMQLLADIFGCRLIRSEPGGLEGAALLAGAPAGKNFSSKTFLPDLAKHPFWQRRRQRFDELDQLSPTHAPPHSPS